MSVGSVFITLVLPYMFTGQIQSGDILWSSSVSVSDFHGYSWLPVNRIVFQAEVQNT